MIKEINLTGEALLGIDRSQLVDKPFISIIGKNYRWKFKSHLQQSRQVNDAVTMELELLVKNGKPIYVQLISVTYRSSVHHPIEYRVLIIDNTRLNNAEQMLLASEERFRKLSEASFEGIAIHDKGKILEANQNFANMFGYTLAEVIGMHALDFAAPESRELISKNIKTKSEKSYEAFGLRKDGSILSVEIRGKSVFYRGCMVRVAAIRDLTERKEAEKALRESEKRYRFLVESINDGLAQADENQIITFTNKKLCKLLGYDESELVGKSIFNFVSKSDKEAMLRQREMRKKGSEHNYEVELVRKDGTNFYAYISPKAIFDVNGNYTGTVAACKDISELKHKEEKIKGLLKEKEVLLKEIHHRIKNNLQYIISLLELHSSHMEDKKASKLYKNCQRRIKTIAYIHEHLYQSNDLVKVNIKLYFQDLINYLIQVYEINTDVIKLKLNVDDILLDNKKAIPCGLIINELVSNALKYAFPGGMVGNLHIKFCRINIRKYMLTVEDNGIGLPKDFDFKNTDTIGLQLVTLLTQQIDGDLDHNGECGTEVKITFSE